MKKITVVAALFAVIFCFAACNKNKGEVYVPPMTEVVTFEDGVTAVFEVVTEADGEPATDAEGETMYIPYVPPVTEKGGYLVTDAQGETMPSRPGSTTADSAKPTDKVIENDLGELDGETQKGENKPTQKPDPDKTTKPDSTTKKNDSSVLEPVKTTKPDSTTAKQPEKTTAPPDYDEPTSALDGVLTAAKAQKLESIMESVENPFEEDLVDGDFYAAEKSIDDYIKNIEAAVNEIKADKALYQFVGNEPLNKWLGSMKEAKDYYAIFMTMHRQEEGKSEKNPLFYKAYTDFQGYYRASLESYYFILFAAKDRT